MELVDQIRFSMDNNQLTCGIFVDLSKAFDTVKHDLLFQKLADKIPPLFLRLIIYSYVHQKVYVRWSGAKSVSFDVNNGVRQGAVASPIFFNAYLDELFTILKIRVGVYN